MKRINLIIAGALLITASLIPTPRTSANGDVNEILANMQAAASKVKTYYAKLEEKRRNPYVGGGGTYRAEMFFKHIGRSRDRIRINYQIPQGRFVAVNDKEILFFDKGTNQCIITPRNAAASKNQEFAFFAAPYSINAQQIKDRYEIVHVKDENVNGSQTAVLELTPRVASSAKKVKWWVDRSSWFPVRSEVVAQNDEVSTFTISGARINEPISDKQIECECPSGSERIRR